MQDNKQLPPAAVLDSIERGMLDWQKELTDITLMGIRLGQSVRQARAEKCWTLVRRWRGDGGWW